MPVSAPRALLIGVLVLAAAVASAQPVTVEITVPDSLRSSELAIGVRGDTAPLAWDRSVSLSDADGDGVYSATLDFPEGTGLVDYRVLAERGTELAWEPGGNRLLAPGRMTTDQRAWGGVQTSLPLQTISSRQLRQDFYTLQTTLQSVHPGLMLHATEADLEQALTRLLGRATALSREYGETIPVSEMYLAVAEGLAAVRDGHTQLNPYNQGRYTRATLYAQPDRVPFAFRLVGDRMIVTGDATAANVLPAGTEILALDGRPTSEVIDALIPLIRSDGGNDAKRRNLLQVFGTSAAEDFDIFYPLVFDINGDLELTTRQPDGTETTLTVPRTTAAARRTTLLERDPALPRTKDDEFQLRYLEDGTAVLRIGTFATFNMEMDYSAWLASSFRDLKERGTDRLVVDLRGNEGGMDNSAAALAMHLLRDPAEVDFWGSVMAYSTFPESLRGNVSSWNTDYLDVSDRVTPNGDGTFNAGDAYTITLPPAPDAFTGQAVVLVDAAASSATFYLARQIKRLQIAPLVGQVTGGSLKGLNASQSVFLTLPNSGIVVDVPLIGARPAEPGPDRGVVPDVVVEPDADAVIAGRDLELEAALDLFSGSAPVSTAPAPAQSAAQPLLGTWTVDLRPTPDTEAYTQSLILRTSDNSAFAGSFYNSPLQSSALNDNWGDLRIAFTTSDGSGMYHHTAVLRGGRLEGTTHSLGRDVLSVWTAERQLDNQ